MRWKVAQDGDERTRKIFAILFRTDPNTHVRYWLERVTVVERFHANDYSWEDSYWETISVKSVTETRRAA